MKRLLRWGFVVLPVLGIGGTAIAVPRLPDRGTGVPTARVTRGPLR
jgi:hypothetical protein